MKCDGSSPASLHNFYGSPVLSFPLTSCFLVYHFIPGLLPPRDLDAADSGAATIDDNNSRHHCRQSFLLVSLFILVFSFDFYCVCVCVKRLEQFF